MFKILIIKEIHQLSDESTEFMINDRLTFQRFLGLELCDKVPDAKTIWQFRESLIEAEAMEKLFDKFNALDVSDFKHHRINHSKLFVDDKNHINGIENFWNQAKRHMRKFNGIPKNYFELFLKECEWRF